MKLKKFFAVYAVLLCAFQCFSYEFTVKATPSIMFPFLSGGTAKYDVAGGGGFIDAGINLMDLINVGPSFGYFILPKNNAKALNENSSSSISIVPVGIQAGVFAYPLSRMEVGGGVAAGASVAINGGKYHYAPWYRAFGEVDFRLNPTLSVGLNGSWFNVQNNTWFGNPGAAGVTAGISVKFKFDTKKSAGRVDAYADMDESVFPLLYTIYKENPLGTISIENNETAEIRNVIVRFRSENYTASDIECGRVSVIRKHKTAEIDFYADFGEEILQFSEEGKISGELVIDYELLGKKRTSISQITVPVYNRNQVRWMDPAVLSSYISTNSQEVLEFSKYIVGVARKYVRSGLNRNMQFAMYVEEAIRLAGIKVTSDSSTPYDVYHKNPDTLDFIQYPYQTISYKTGDKDDVGILFMAMLESVGIDAAFIPLDDDFIVCFNMGIGAEKAGNFFDGYDRILIAGDDVWIPLSMSAINEGFINSWYKGVIALQNATEKNEDFEFVLISDAWQYYPPAGFSSGGSSTALPAEDSVSQAVEQDISRYITVEFGPQIAAVQNKIKTEGGSVTLYNQLGMLYVRAGMYSSAIPVYEISAKLGSVSAMNNLGNIASLQKKYTTAQSWYTKALEIDPENKTAKKNLERIASELSK